MARYPWLPVRAGLRAGAIHISFSALIALCAIAVIFFVWYPGELASAQGVSLLVLVLIGVDVALGPLLTTLLYKPGKSGLRFDLFMIALLQTLALLYGMRAIYSGRPAYLVFNVDRFDVVPVQSVDEESLARAAAEFRTSFWMPLWVAARMPTDPQERTAILFSSLSGGADLPQLPEYFVPLENEKALMLNRLRPIDELRKLNKMGQAEWVHNWAEFGRTESELGYLPMRANARDGAVILDSRSGEVLGIRMLAPSFESLDSERKRLGPPPGSATMVEGTL